MVKQKAVFLDRDGVINHSIKKSGLPFAPRKLVDFKIINGVKDALATFRQRGFLNVIVTNQPDVANGLLDKADLDGMHKVIMDTLPVDAIYVCEHANEAFCQCRKPQIGMLERASSQHQIALHESLIVGDRWKDIECGQSAGLKQCFFIDYGYKESLPKSPYVVINKLSDVIQYM